MKPSESHRQQETGQKYVDPTRRRTVSFPGRLELTGFFTGLTKTMHFGYSERKKFPSGPHIRTDSTQVTVLFLDFTH